MALRPRLTTSLPVRERSLRHPYHSVQIYAKCVRRASNEACVKKNQKSNQTDSFCHFLT
ncbi:hypothetical protein BH10PLA2_BH10PLA2_24730 [soil metagenome]